MITIKNVRRLLRRLRMRLALAACVIATSLVALPCPAHADLFADKSDLFLKKDLASLSLLTPEPIVIQLNVDLTSLITIQLNLLGVVNIKPLPAIRGLSATLPLGKLVALANLPVITRISKDVSMVASDEFTVGATGADIAFQQYGLAGDGVTVAVLDSGIKSRPDLNVWGGSSSRVVANVSFVPNDSTTDDACGHGTHVAGIVGGNGSSSYGGNCFRTFYGIARRTKIANVRVMDASGMSTVSTVINGIQWVLDNKAAYNIRVMNISMGHAPGESASTDPLCLAVEKAWKAGIVVVCAAGNGGRVNSSPSAGSDNGGYGTAYGSIDCPGNDPYVITVGAMKAIDGDRTHDTIATYSGRGPSRLDFVLKPDLVAPGNRVISLRSPNSTLDNQFGSSNVVPMSYYKSGTAGSSSSQYFYLSGTSMATPVVSGAAALLLQNDPSLTPDTIKARLMVSADKWADPQGNFDPCSYGAGYLNIPAALNCSVVATSAAISPTISRDSDGNVYLNNALWGSNALWGTKAIWGTGVSNLNAIWGCNSMSGSNAIWGSKALWGSNAMWGTNALWGTKALWGTAVWSNNAIWGSNTMADVVMASITGE